MLSKIIIELKKDKNQYITQNMSYFFQGIIMENISFDYGEEMHISNIRPYSQFLQIFDDKILWIVSTLNQKAYKNIILPLLEDSFDRVDCCFEIVSKKFESIDINSFVDDKFLGKEERYLKLKFISPCSFKSQNEYIFYPTVKHIFHSLVSKFDSAGYNYSVFTPELIEDFEKYISVIQYNLKSRYFHLKGAKIPSFSGEITLKITGPKQLVNLANLLLYFGEYSGVGIKSAIGMGALAIEKRS